MNNLNKNDVISVLAERADVSKNTATHVLDAFMDLVKTTLSDGDKITLVGFGTFGVSERKARVGRNPQTGQEIQIPARAAEDHRPGFEQPLMRLDDLVLHDQTFN